MSFQNLKDELKDLLEENEGLRDFALECIEHIFPDKIDRSVAKDQFDTYSELLNEGYGLSLHCILENVATARKNREEYAKNKQAE